jgi:hypothetical protein
VTGYGLAAEQREFDSRDRIFFLSRRPPGLLSNGYTDFFARK